MKTHFARLLGLVLAVVPLAVTAQTNVKAAFEAITKSPDAQISVTNRLEKDPETKQKSGQCDVYDFVLPKQKINLINKVFSAFDKDSQMAYSINRGKTLKKGDKIEVAVGDGSQSSVRINEDGSEYIYALFLAPKSEDSDGKYRYAYALSYKESGSNIVGKLVVTYATTLKYRQQRQEERRMKVLNSNGATVVSNDGAYIISSNSSTHQGWFDTLMSYLQGMSSASPQARVALATKTYKLIRDTNKYSDVKPSDKETAREILKVMISDEKYSDSVLNTLLNQCLIGLK